MTPMLIAAGVSFVTGLAVFKPVAALIAKIKAAFKTKTVAVEAEVKTAETQVATTIAKL